MQAMILHLERLQEEPTKVLTVWLVIWMKGLRNTTTTTTGKVKAFMAKVNLFCIYLLIFLFSVSISRSEDCVYTVYVRTGKIIKGGTDSNISLTLYDAEGYGIRIKNLEAWGGLMGPGYNYFERGNLDIFSGRGPCLNGPVCKMNLTSDGTGSGHGWYCNYVEVTTTGVHQQCKQQYFEVEQWLATDTSPYELTAIRSLCKKSKSESESESNDFSIQPHISLI